MPDAVPSRAPTNKAVAATAGSAFGAAVATLVLYVLDPTSGLPPAVSGSITTITTAVITFASAYFVPPGVNEAVVVVDGAVKSARNT